MDFLWPMGYGKKGVGGSVGGVKPAPVVKTPEPPAKPPAKQPAQVPEPSAPPPPPPPPYSPASYGSEVDSLKTSPRPGQQAEPVPEDYKAHEDLASIADSVLTTMNTVAKEIGTVLVSANKDVSFVDPSSYKRSQQSRPGMLTFQCYLIAENDLLKHQPDEATVLYKFKVHVMNQDQRVGDILQELRFRNGIIAKSVRHLDAIDGNVLQDRLVLARNYKHKNMVIKYTIDKSRVSRDIRRMFLANIQT